MEEWPLPALAFGLMCRRSIKYLLLRKTRRDSDYVAISSTETTVDADVWLSRIQRIPASTATAMAMSTAAGSNESRTHVRHDLHQLSTRQTFCSPARSNAGSMEVLPISQVRRRWARLGLSLESFNISRLGRRCRNGRKSYSRIVPGGVVAHQHRMLNF